MWNGSGPTWAGPFSLALTLLHIAFPPRNALVQRSSRHRKRSLHPLTPAPSMHLLCSTTSCPPQLAQALQAARCAALASQGPRNSHAAENSYLGVAVLCSRMAWARMTRTKCVVLPPQGRDGGAAALPAAQL